MNRVIALVDMDCFYVQVEQKLQPQYKGKPCAVAQYKKWKGGGLIAVGYEARAFGVTRNMMGDDAKKKCPDLHLFRVPELRGKADLTKYREAGAEVITVLSTFSQCVERASVDEAYIDLTDEVDRLIQPTDKVKATDLPNTYIVGYDGEGESGSGVQDWLEYVYDGQELVESNQRLAVGAKIAEEMRAAVYRETGYRCSAGVGHNKMLAKLVCGFHKPNKQTVIPQDSVPGLFSTLPLTKIRHLGGKLGQSVMEQLEVENIGDLCRFTERDLQQLYGDKTGYWLYEVCRGIEREPVSARQLAKSIGCSKNFRGKEALDTREKVRFWLSELSGEVVERLEKDRETNKRVGRSLTVSLRYQGNPAVSASRACALTRYDKDKIQKDAFALLQKFNNSAPHQAAWTPAIICLGMSAGKFEDESGGNSITSFLGNKKSTGDTTLSMASQVQKGSIASFFKSNSSKNDQTDNHLDTTLESSDYDLSSQRILSSSENLGKDATSPACVNLSTKKPASLGGIQSFFTKGRTPERNPEDVSCLSNIPESEIECLNPVTKMESKSVFTDAADKREKKGFFASRKNTETVSSCISPAVTIGADSYQQEGRSNTCISVDQDVLQGLPSDIQLETLDQINPYVPESLTSEPNPQSNGSVEHGISDSVVPVNSDEDYHICEKCQRRILVWDLPEHMDFHFAQDLQNALVYKTPVVAKRKHDSLSPTKNKKQKTKQTSTKTIDSFFGKH